MNKTDIVLSVLLLPLGIAESFYDIINLFITDLVLTEGVKITRVKY